MSHLEDISGWITERLPALLAEHKVPGAAIGVYVNGEVFDFASGVLSHATGVEATTDSVFQIGSITKTLTATLVMQLADDGLLDLDAAVVDYLPDFDLADSDAAKAMTVRQLLCHKAGFEGDIFTDTGWNDDCIEKYVATLTTDPQLFPPDEMFSYNNAGFCVLGRIIEVLRGKPFDQALRDHLFTPLGLTHAATDANSAILFRAAVGHLPNPEDAQAEPVPAPMLTNGGNARDLYGDLYREIFAELAGVTMPPAIEPPAVPVDANITPHLGRYERAGVIEEVLASTDSRDGPTLRTTVTGPLAEIIPDPVDEYAMTPVSPGLWLVREPGTQTWAPVTFYALPTGEKYLHFGVRATPKV